MYLRGGSRYHNHWLSLVHNTLLQEPFPHLVVEGALSTSDYQILLRDWDTAIPQVGIKRPSKENRIPPIDFTWKQELAAQLSKTFGIAGRPTIGRYMFRKQGYELKPHIDPPNLLLTVLHYLPKEGQREDIGTVLYRPSEPAYHTGEGAEYFKCACEPIKVVPFTPNTMLVFLNTPY